MVSKFNLAIKSDPVFVMLLLSLFAAPPSFAADIQRGAPGRPLTGGQKLDSVPSSFPVPIYTGNVLSTNFMQVPTANGLSLTATTRTGDDPSLPFAWYQNLLTRNDWVVVLPRSENATPAETNGSLLMLKASKDNTKVLIICSKMPRSKFTTVNVTTMLTK